MTNATSVAIFSIDPGGKTGVATAVVDLRQITVAKCLRRARAKGNLETWNIGGSFVEQAWKLARGIMDFTFEVHVERALVEDSNIFVVIEDFHIREMAADLSPVRITAGLETLFYSRNGQNMLDKHEGYYTKQSSSEAKGFCNDKMLENYGLLKGKSPHERDALRHLARRLDKLL